MNQERKAIDLQAIYNRQKKEGKVFKRNKWITDNQGLVVAVVKKYLHTGVPYDDLVCYGNLGLLKGLKNFKLESKVPIYLFAWKLIRDGIVDGIKQWHNVKQKNKENKSFDFSLIDDIENFQEPYVEMDIKNFDYDRIVDEVKQIKNEKHKSIFCMYFGIGIREHSIKEITLNYDITVDGVWKIIYRIINFLSKKFNK